VTEVTGAIIIAVLFVSMIWAGFCDMVAQAKGYSGWKWLILGFLCGPIALLALCALPNLFPSPMYIVTVPNNRSQDSGS